MGALKEFEKEKLIVGIIYNNEELYNRAIDALVKEFGEIEDMCESFSFSKEFSTYYDEELGGEGFRRIISFKALVEPDRQADIKTFTNRLELELSEGGNRRVNLDPGFINHGRLMLATTKPQGFRIPLKDGIYTELTLFYARGEWHKLPWSYRDYQSKRVQDFLTLVRGRYLKQRKANNSQK